MNDHDAVAKGAQAEAAMGVLSPALAEVRQALIDALTGTSPEQTARILSLHASIQAVDATKQVLQRVIADGQVAKAIIEAA